MQIGVGQCREYQIVERADAIGIFLSEPNPTQVASWNLDIFAENDIGRFYVGTIETVSAANSPRLARLIAYAVCPGSRAWSIEAFGNSLLLDGVTIVPAQANLHAVPCNPAAFAFAPGIYRPLGRTIWNGSLTTAEGNDSTAPLASSRVDFTSPIVFQGASGSNETAATIWIMFFDSGSVPANGTQPTHGLSFNVPAGGTFSFTAPAPGLFFRKGLTWVASSTPNTLTAIAAGNTARVVTQAGW